MSAWEEALAAVSCEFIDGVVSRLYGTPRKPPEIYDEAEAADWLAGYDA